MSDIVKPAKQPPGRRRDVLRVLRAATSPMSIVAIAETLDVHPNTVRFHLDTLVSTGRVDQVAPDPKGPGRPALMFRATRRMDTGGPRHHRLLAEILATDLAGNRDAEAKALAAGHAWGVQLNRPLRSAPGHPTRTNRSSTWSVYLTSSALPLSVAETIRWGCGTARSWNWRKARKPSSVQSTWGSCGARWKPGRRRSRSIGWTRFVEPDMCLVQVAATGGSVSRRSRRWDWQRAEFFW
jgi:hypothetical protein